MAHDENTRLEAQTKQNESVFSFRMVRVEELNRVLIVENVAGFIKGDTVLMDVGLFLFVIPLKPQLVHTYTVRMDRIRVKYVPFAARVHAAYTTGL